MTRRRLFPLRAILCPTDFSDPSLEGLEVAVELAARFTASLHVVHVIGRPSVPVVPLPPPQAFDYESLRTHLRESAERQLAEVLSKCVPDPIPHEGHVLFGQPADEITALADARDVDLVVLATHGHTGWRRFVYGSVAERVVRLCERSVLAVQVAG